MQYRHVHESKPNGNLNFKYFMSETHVFFFLIDKLTFFVEQYAKFKHVEALKCIRLTFPMKFKCIGFFFLNENIKFNIWKC